MNRRDFLHTAALAGAAAAGLGAKGESSSEVAHPQQKRLDPDSITTNIDSVKDAPRTEWSMPGKLPGVVTEVHHPEAVEGSKANPQIAAEMLAAGMKSLTGEDDPVKAWSLFFSPSDRVGIKINPIGGKLLSNTHELTAAVIACLEAAGLPRSNIIIWDRRQEQMNETDYTEDSYPGIKCIGTEYKVLEDGKEVWRGEDRLDKNVFYEFDIVGEYPEELMPYHIHGGTKSYFTRILTEMVDKVINLPVLKNAGGSVTLALKNLAYGVTSNTGRGHQIWSRFIAEVCAFPPVRDKVVLNIVDGLRGCYEGGPGAVARYIWNAKTLWLATDPVALDHIGWEKIFAKRVAEGVAWEEQRGQRDYYLNKLSRAEELGLGVYDRAKIDHRTVPLGREQRQG